jgi:hypothetical protein
VNIHRTIRRSTTYGANDAGLLSEVKDGDGRRRSLLKI